MSYFSLCSDSEDESGGSGGSGSGGSAVGGITGGVDWNGGVPGAPSPEKDDMEEVMVDFGGGFKKIYIIRNDLCILQ